MLAPATLDLPEVPFEALWHAPIGLALLDAHGRLQRGNPHLSVLCGVPVEALLGRPLNDALPGLSRLLELAASGRALAGEELAGSPPLVVTVQPVRAGLLVVLQRAPDRAGEILRQLPAAVIVQPVDGAMHANDRLRRLLGAHDGGLLESVREVHRTDGSLYEFTDLPAIRAARGESVQAEELVITRADGSELVARVSAVPVRDPDGAVVAGVAVCEDVTVRRRLEEEQQKLLSLLESSADVIGIAGLDGRTLYLNERAWRLFGLKSFDDALSRPLSAFVTAEAAQLALREALPQIKAGARWTGEVELLHFQTGERILLEVSAFRVGGGAVGVIGRDIRERKRAEADRAQLVGELEAKQKQLDAVLQQMPAGVIVAAAPSGTLLFSNEQAERILRRALFPVEAGARARMSLGTRPDGSPIERDDWPLQRSLRAGEVVEGEEIEVMRGDGTRALLRCNSAPLRDRAGATFAAMVVFEDVTAEKKVERALLESEARFRRLSESGMIGVFFASAARISEANDAFLQLIGRSRDELRAGLGVQDLTPADHAVRDEVALIEARRKGVCKPYEKDFFHADGSRIPALVGAALLEDGSDDCAFFVIDDRERKKAEELQRQLMGIVSHDLRSPLSAVNMASALLLNAEDLPERHYKTVARIHSSSERMRGLIGDLLDYQQARVGRGLPLMRRPCDLHTVCSAVAQELEIVHAGRELEYLPGDDGRGHWDAGRLSQVVQNLLSNAFHHSPPGSPVRLSFSSEGAGVQLEVHNGGPPIPEEFMPHLFQPFRRAHTREGGAQGFGLGLFIVREIVRAHGGTVSVRSTAAEGTTFTVHLARS